jgi:hypothetical protein
VSAAPAYSLWLLPRQDAQQQLAGVVARLSRSFGTRTFVPHVTVQGDLTHRLREVTAVAEDIARTLQVQHWPVRGIEQSMHYYRAFYLAFDGCDGFAPLGPRCARAFGTDAGLSPFAHLSLAYGTLDAAAKGALARDVAAEIPPTLTFDRLAVALSGSSVGIASWRTLQCFDLVPSAPGLSGESSS